MEIVYICILWSFGIFYEDLGYFMTIWYILYSINAFFCFWYRVPRKIWQPWFDKCTLLLVLRFLCFLCSLKWRFNFFFAQAKRLNIICRGEHYNGIAFDPFSPQSFPNKMGFRAVVFHLQGCQIFLRASYQNGINILGRWPQSGPTVRKIHQMTFKDSHTFHSKALAMI
jgi:hypothetical protein